MEPRSPSNEGPPPIPKKPSQIKPKPPDKNVRKIATAKNIGIAKNDGAANSKVASQKKEAEIIAVKNKRAAGNEEGTKNNEATKNKENAPSPRSSKKETKIPRLQDAKVAGKTSESIAKLKSPVKKEIEEKKKSLENRDDKDRIVTSVQNKVNISGNDNCISDKNIELSAKSENTSAGNEDIDETVSALNDKTEKKSCSSSNNCNYKETQQKLKVSKEENIKIEEETKQKALKPQNNQEIDSVDEVCIGNNKLDKNLYAQLHRNSFRRASGNKIEELKLKYEENFDKDTAKLKRPKSCEISEVCNVNEIKRTSDKENLIESGKKSDREESKRIERKSSVEIIGFIKKEKGVVTFEEERETTSQRTVELLESERVKQEEKESFSKKGNLSNETSLLKGVNCLEENIGQTHKYPEKQIKYLNEASTPDENQQIASIKSDSHTESSSTTNEEILGTSNLKNSPIAKTHLKIEALQSSLSVKLPKQTVESLRNKYSPSSFGYPKLIPTYKVVKKVQFSEDIVLNKPVPPPRPKLKIVSPTTTDELIVSGEKKSPVPLPRTQSPKTKENFNEGFNRLVQKEGGCESEVEGKGEKEVLAQEDATHKVIAQKVLSQKNLAQIVVVKELIPKQNTIDTVQPKEVEGQEINLKEVETQETTLKEDWSKRSEEKERNQKENIKQKGDFEVLPDKEIIEEVKCKEEIEDSESLQLQEGIVEKVVLDNKNKQDKYIEVDALVDKDKEIQVKEDLVEEDKTIDFTTEDDEHINKERNKENSFKHLQDNKDQIQEKSDNLHFNEHLEELNKNSKLLKKEQIFSTDSHYIEEQFSEEDTKLKKTTVSKEAKTNVLEDVIPTDTSKEATVPKEVSFQNQTISLKDTFNKEVISDKQVPLKEDILSEEITSPSKLSLHKVSLDTKEVSSFEEVSFQKENNSPKEVSFNKEIFVKKEFYLKELSHNKDVSSLKEESKSQLKIPQNSQEFTESSHKNHRFKNPISILKHRRPNSSIESIKKDQQTRQDRPKSESGSQSKSVIITEKDIVYGEIEFAEPEQIHFIVRQSSSEDSVEEIRKFLNEDITMDKKEKKKRSGSFRKLFSGNFFGRSSSRDEDKKSKKKEECRKKKDYCDVKKEEHNKGGRGKNKEWGYCNEDEYCRRDCCKNEVECYRNEGINYKKEEGMCRNQEEIYRNEKDTYVNKKSSCRHKDGGFRNKNDNSRINEDSYRNKDDNFRSGNGNYRNVGNSYRSKEGIFKKEGDYRNCEENTFEINMKNEKKKEAEREEIFWRNSDKEKVNKVENAVFADNVQNEYFNKRKEDKKAQRKNSKSDLDFVDCCTGKDKHRKMIDDSALDDNSRDHYRLGGGELLKEKKEKNSCGREIEHEFGYKEMNVNPQDFKKFKGLSEDLIDKTGDFEEAEERFAQMHINKYIQIKARFDDDKFDYPREEYVDMDNPKVKKAKENYENIPRTEENTSLLNTFESNVRNETYQNALIAQAELFQQREMELRRQEKMKKKVVGSGSSPDSPESKKTSFDNSEGKISNFGSPSQIERKLARERFFANEEPYENLQLIKPKAIIPINSERPLPNPYHNDQIEECRRRGESLERDSEKSIDKSDAAELRKERSFSLDEKNRVETIKVRKQSFDLKTIDRNLDVKDFKTFSKKVDVGSSLEDNQNIYGVVYDEKLKVTSRCIESKTGFLPMENSSKIDESLTRKEIENTTLLKEKTTEMTSQIQESSSNSSSREESLKFVSSQQESSAKEPLNQILPGEQSTRIQTDAQQSPRLNSSLSRPPIPSQVSPRKIENSKLKLPSNREKIDLQPRIKSPIPQTKVSTDKIIATELLKTREDQNPQRKARSRESSADRKGTESFEFEGKIVNVRRRNSDRRDELRRRRADHQGDVFQRDYGNVGSSDKHRNLVGEVFTFDQRVYYDSIPRSASPALSNIPRSRGSLSGCTVDYSPKNSLQRGGNLGSNTSTPKSSLPRSLMRERQEFGQKEDQIGVKLKIGRDDRKEDLENTFRIAMEATCVELEERKMRKPTTRGVQVLQEEAKQPSSSEIKTSSPIFVESPNSFDQMRVTSQNKISREVLHSPRESTVTLGVQIAQEEVQYVKTKGPKGPLIIAVSPTENLFNNFEQKDQQNFTDTVNPNIIKNTNLNEPQNIQLRFQEQAYQDVPQNVRHNVVQKSSQNSQQKSPKLQQSPKSPQETSQQPSGTSLSFNTTHSPINRDFRSSTPISLNSLSPNSYSPSKKEIREQVEAFCWKELKKLKEKEELDMYHRLQLSRLGYAEEPVVVRRCRSVSPTSARSGKRSLSLPRTSQNLIRQQNSIPENEVAIYNSNYPQLFVRNSPQRRTLDTTYGVTEGFKPIFKRGSLSSYPVVVPEEQVNKKVSFRGTWEKGEGPAWPTKNGYTQSPPSRKIEKKNSETDDDVFLPDQNNQEYQRLDDMIHINNMKIREALISKEPNYKIRQNLINPDGYIAKTMSGQINQVNENVEASEISKQPSKRSQSFGSNQPHNVTSPSETLIRQPQSLSKQLQMSQSRPPLPQRHQLGQFEYVSKEQLLRESPYGSRQSVAAKYTFDDYSPYGSRIPPGTNQHTYNIVNPLYGSRSSIAGEPTYYRQVVPKQVTISNKVCDIYGRIHDTGTPKMVHETGVIYGQLKSRELPEPIYEGRQMVRRRDQNLPKQDDFYGYTDKDGNVLDSSGRYVWRRNDEDSFSGQSLNRKYSFDNVQFNQNAGYVQYHNQPNQNSQYRKQSYNEVNQNVSYRNQMEQVANQQNRNDQYNNQPNQNVQYRNFTNQTVQYHDQPNQTVQYRNQPMQNIRYLTQEDINAQYTKQRKNTISVPYPNHIIYQEQMNALPIYQHQPSNFVRGTRLTASANDMYRRYDPRFIQRIPQQNKAAMDVPNRPLPPIPTDGKSGMFLQRRASSSGGRRYQATSDVDSDASEVQRILKNEMKNDVLKNEMGKNKMLKKEAGARNKNFAGK